jgi:hypothetical protein
LLAVRSLAVDVWDKPGYLAYFLNFLKVVFSVLFKTFKWNRKALTD